MTPLLTLQSLDALYDRLAADIATIRRGIRISNILLAVNVVALVAFLAYSIYLGTL